MPTIPVPPRKFPPEDLLAQVEYKSSLPYDPRYPSVNQNSRCIQNYVDFHRCINLLGEEHTPCYFFKRTYSLMCHQFIIDKFDEQRSNGTFPEDLSPSWRPETHKRVKVPDHH